MYYRGIFLGKLAPGVATAFDGMALFVNGDPVVSIPISVCLYLYDVSCHGKMLLLVRICFKSCNGPVVRKAWRVVGAKGKAVAQSD